MEIIAAILGNSTVQKALHDYPAFCWAVIILFGLPGFLRALRDTFRSK